MASERVGVTGYPLYWPAGWKRTRRPSPSRFGATTVYQESQAVLAEMERIGAKRVVISTNLKLRQDGIPYSGQKAPEDAGVAVWFWLPKPGVGRYERFSPSSFSEHVLACDAWSRVEHNLHAIALHVAALRGQERWGVGSVAQSFGGYVALPESLGDDSGPWRTLGVKREGATIEKVEAAFRRESLVHHPDRGGSRESWDRLCDAKAAALRALIDRAKEGP